MLVCEHYATMGCPRGNLRKLKKGLKQAGREHQRLWEADHVCLSLKQTTVVKDCRTNAAP